MNYTDHTTAVTTRLVDMIRTGSHGQWAMPWHTHGTAALLNTRNAITGTPYTGANTVALFLDALERGFPTADYATFNQYRKTGAQVRKGVLSLMINVVAVLVFCIAADVAWGAAGVLAGSSLIGGYAGARTSLRLPTPVLRGVVLLFGAVALTRLLFT